MSVSREQLVRRAGLDDDFVHRLHELGELRGSDDAYEKRDVHVAALLRMWERAGLSAPTILAAVDAGTLSLDFLDSPAWELPDPLPMTYRQLAEDHRIPLHLLQGIQEAMGFAAPAADDRVRPDDALLAELARILRDLGASDEGIRRLFRVCAGERCLDRMRGYLEERGPMLSRQCCWLMPYTRPSGPRKWRQE